MRKLSAAWLVTGLHILLLASVDAFRPSLAPARLDSLLAGRCVRRWPATSRGAPIFSGLPLPSPSLSHVPRAPAGCSCLSDSGGARQGRPVAVSTLSYLLLARAADSAPSTRETLTWQELNRETKDFATGQLRCMVSSSDRGIRRVYVSTIALDVPAPLAPVLALLDAIPIISGLVRHYMVILEIGDLSGGRCQLILCDFEPFEKTSPATTLKLLTAGEKKKLSTRQSYESVVQFPCGGGRRCVACIGWVEFIFAFTRGRNRLATQEQWTGACGNDDSSRYHAMPV